MILDPPVKNLLVDLDGTLLGNRNIPLSISFVTQAVGTLRKKVGTRHAARTLLALNKEFTRPSTEQTNDLRVVRLFSEMMDLPLEDARNVLREGISAIFPTLRKHFYPIRGAKEFLDWAKGHYKLVLATNPVWPTDIVEMRVRWAGIDPSIFQSITHIRAMHSCKPALEYYEEILKQNSFDAKECLLIGNEIKMDLPATRAGIRVFIVGKFSKLKDLSHPEGKARAWRGSYGHLKKALEKSHQSSEA